MEGDAGHQEKQDQRCHRERHADVLEAVMHHRDLRGICKCNGQGAREGVSTAHGASAAAAERKSTRGGRLPWYCSRKLDDECVALPLTVHTSTAIAPTTTLKTEAQPGPRAATRCRCRWPWLRIHPPGYINPPDVNIQLGMF